MTASTTQAVTLRSPLRWLALGWADLWANPVPGLVHGALMAAFGLLIFVLARERFWLLAGAFSGFLILAPMLASGLYVVSRELARGRKATLSDIAAFWRTGDRRLVRFGLLLGLAGTGWVMTSAALITKLSDVPIQRPLDFLRHVVLHHGVGLFEIWLLLGALLAAPVFASSVTAIPTLVDRDVSVEKAVGQSWRAVASHPLPMALWAVVIGVLIGLGMATGMLGLILILPWVAHASWHAYRDLAVAP